MKLRKSEEVAYNWLIAHGYKTQEIEHKPTESPDFICRDGKRYEAKKAELFFTPKQKRFLTDNDMILIICGEKIIAEVNWKYIKNTITSQINLYNISLPDSLKEYADKLAAERKLSEILSECLEKHKARAEAKVRKDGRIEEAKA